MVERAAAAAWEQHERAQRRAWLRLTARQRLDWLWEARQFALRAASAPRRRQAPGSGPDPGDRGREA